VTDWLRVCREAREAVERVLVELPTRSEREPVVGTGEGGDETTAVDLAAENAVVGRLTALHESGLDFTLVSEELGEREFGDAGAPLRIVLDPIDGSLNAKRGIPFFSLSVAVAEGAAMRDVVFGYVFDFGTGEEWVARRGEGAFLNEERLDGPGPKDEIEIVSFEATRTDLVAEKAPGIVGLAYRTRIMGSLALSLCHLAAGRVDAVCSLKPARSVDIAAAQLLVRERGLAIDLPEDESFEGAALDVVARSRVVAAANETRCRELFEALSSSR
jgi:myo-inositol-1(or 4)-monophosphatase